MPTLDPRTLLQSEAPPGFWQLKTMACGHGCHKSWYPEQACCLCFARTSAHDPEQVRVCNLCYTRWQEG